ncbi:MAG: HpcH/HpaI aldolase/citrate lyase family protein [Erysipelotrichaceae bacterium]|nr:HpcH/HpaI aldolase/citrate lyase family protein [Erysipelotrichaceae bacterium]
MLRRSALFMPGNNPAMLLSAPILGSDCIIFDLEDSVSLNQKDSARLLVKHAIETLDFGSVEVVVRINPVSSQGWKQDLREIVPVYPDAIMIPKACKEDVEEIERFILEIEEEKQLTKKVKLMIIVETAYGIETIVETLRCSRRIECVLLGAEDLTTDLGIKRTKEGYEIDYARAKVAMAARAFSVQAMDTPFTDVEDTEGLVKDTLHAKSLGFSAKACIHPNQVDAIHAVFDPTQSEIDSAIEILEERDRALSSGLGVFSIHGKMIDLPVIQRAQNIVDLARKTGKLK